MRTIRKCFQNIHAMMKKQDTASAAKTKNQLNFFKY